MALGATAIAKLQLPNCNSAAFCSQQPPRCKTGVGRQSQLGGDCIGCSQRDYPQSSVCLTFDKPLSYLIHRTVAAAGNHRVKAARQVPCLRGRGAGRSCGRELHLDSSFHEGLCSGLDLG
jgi:hypothetical protein